MTYSTSMAESQRTTLELDAEGGITIPTALLRELGIGEGDRVKLSQNGERIKIEPVQRIAKDDE